MRYDRTIHAARRSESFVFAQLIPYLGNKRKLLGLIGEAIESTGATSGRFADLFAGSGVVSRFAKTKGFGVLANDWEPYARALNACWLSHEAPRFIAQGGYERAIEQLNQVEPLDGWITRHLCPDDDERIDPSRDRLFFTRANGRKLDAMRTQIATWQSEGTIDAHEADCLLAPLLYAACYVSNTSGVFKGFHAGWGGKTGTALYRIRSEVRLRPATFFAGAPCEVTQGDATAIARSMGRVEIAYLDPPYNQHPYASNYHVLNTLALNDAPALPAKITPGTKAAIREDWKRDRRSPYNHRAQAADAFAELLSTIDARFILVSYSTDGTIPLESLLGACVARGATSVRCATYKRYRVSTQRFSEKPVNVEFVVTIDTSERHADVSVESIAELIRNREQDALARQTTSS